MLTLNEALKYAGIKPTAQPETTVEESTKPAVQNDAAGKALNEALRTAGLPQRKLDEARKKNKGNMSSDDIKAKLLKNVTGANKKAVENAEFKSIGRGLWHINDRMDLDDPDQKAESDGYESNANGHQIRVAVMDDGEIRITDSQKHSGRTTSDD